MSSPFEQLRFAREIIAAEGKALSQLATRLDTSFCDAAAHVVDCRGSVIVSGVGKAGLIGKKSPPRSPPRAPARTSCMRPRPCTATWGGSMRPTSS